MAGEAVRERLVGDRRGGNAPDGGETELLTGTYVLDGEVGGRLLRAPGGGRRARGGAREPADRAARVRDAPGQEAVLDRLLDLLLIAALRAWLSRADAHAPGWYSAHADPVVGHALRLIHDDPAHGWTVASLAHEAGVSRAALARRFTDLVGEPPMAYLAGWRIALAADLLHEPGSTIGSVADQVGYGSPYALSTAFKRLRGMSPKAHRAAA